MSLETDIKQAALAGGADMAGIVKAADMAECAEAMARIVPGARSIVVVATRHSLSALSARTNEVAQFDTIHTYDECARAAHRVARHLEDAGHAAAAVPAFIPLDMRGPRRGMRGEIDWRAAAVRAGLGSYGENGLLVTPRYGSAVRIAGTVTSADLRADPPLAEDACDHCRHCLEACPPKALAGGGRVDKKKCGDHIFRYGFRAFHRLMSDLAEGGETARSAVKGFALRELWQNFMTGNYYYCFRCQTQCHREDGATADKP